MEYNDDNLIRKLDPEGMALYLSLLLSPIHDIIEFKSTYESFKKYNNCFQLILNKYNTYNDTDEMILYMFKHNLQNNIIIDRKYIHFHEIQLIISNDDSELLKLLIDKYNYFADYPVIIYNDIFIFDAVNCFRALLEPKYVHIFGDITNIRHNIRVCSKKIIFEYIRYIDAHKILDLQLYISICNILIINNFDTAFVIQQLSKLDVSNDTINFIIDIMIHWNIPFPHSKKINYYVFKDLIIGLITLLISFSLIFCLS